jgi:hypothetical protein
VVRKKDRDISENEIEIGIGIKVVRWCSRPGNLQEICSL